MSERRRKTIAPTRELRAIVDRIVNLQKEKREAIKEFDGQITDAFEAAERKNYDIPALKLAIRRRHESASARQTRMETEELADIYSAAIGDLFGRPLDDLTRRRIDERKREQDEKATPSDAPPIGGDDAPQTPTAAESEPPAGPTETIEQAHDRGKADHKAGKRIIDNPYHSSDPKRAAWDEGWCEEDGSDGMDIPAAWRRKPKAEDEKGEGEEGGDHDGEEK